MVASPIQLLEAVRRAAAVLIEEGATEVYLFGSVAGGRTMPASDIDLAVAGLPARRFFAAMARAHDAAGVPIDLVDLDQPTLFARYLRRSGELRRVA